MKKKSIALALSALMVSGLVGCGNSSEGENKSWYGNRLRNNR